MTREKIKIVHLISSLQMGGAEMALHGLMRSMDRTLFENVVISMADAGDVGRMLTADGTELLTLNMKRGVADPRGLARLVRALRRIRPDVLQSWMYHADFAGQFAAKLSGVQSTVWNIRCAYLDLASVSLMLRGVIRTLAAASAMPDAVIANSLAGKEFHRKLGYRPQRWEVIPNGFDLEQLRPDNRGRRLLRTQLGFLNEQPVVGLVARYDPLKDHSNFLQAAALLSSQFPDARYILAGRGVDTRNSILMRQIVDLGLSEAVRLLGEVDGSAAVNVALDIATLSSRGEGFPNVIGEAMACGVPCVATDVGDSGSLIGDTGLIVPPRDPAALADAWATLIEAGPEERRRLGLRARERIRREFSLQASTERYEQLYRQLVRAQSGDHS